MIIQSGFYLSGFTRRDLGEEGAVFVHYEEPPTNARGAEIKETPMYYGGPDTANYTLSIPKPKAKEITACAIVTRTSKNCYQASVFDKKHIGNYKADTLDGLRRICADFFGV